MLIRFGKGDELAQKLNDMKDRLSVVVWGSYPFTQQYQTDSYGAIDIPVTVIDEQGFAALVEDPGEADCTILIISQEIIGDSLLTDAMIGHFQTLADRGIHLFFMTDDEDQASRIATAVSGDYIDENTADAEKDSAILYALHIHTGVPEFMYFEKTNYEKRQPQRDERILSKSFCE